MRALLMITNNQMSLRELYTAILDTHPAGWMTSFMSGMPGNAESIVAGYDLVIYELGVPDSADRLAPVLAFRRAGATVVTHLEGRQAAQRAEELKAAGVFVVENPLTGDAISATLDAVAARLRNDRAAHRESFRQRLRRVFTG